MISADLKHTYDQVLIEKKSWLLDHGRNNSNEEVPL